MESNINLPKTTGTSSVSTDEILAVLSRRKWLYLSILLISGALSFWVLKYMLFTYTSQASFYMSEGSGGASVGQNKEYNFDGGINANEQFNRAYQLVNSTQLYDHLIKKFNLIKHYGIDTTNEFYYESALARLSGSIVIKKTPFNQIAVFVSDKHRYLAAEMANEILRFCDETNKKLIMNSMTQKLELYDLMLKKAQEDSDTRTALFKAQMSELNTVMTRLERQPVNSMALLDLQSRLGGLISRVESSTEELIRMKVFYSLAVQSIKEKNLPSVVVVIKARPSHRSIGWQSILICGMIMLLVLSGIIYSIYFKLRYKNYLHVLMSNNKPIIEFRQKQKASK